MSEGQSLPEQNAIETKSPAPAPQQDFFRQKSNLLLIASILLFLGFFLPWIGVAGGRRRYDNDIPTINGTFLLSNTGELTGYSWLALLFLLSILAGSAIVAYNSYLKNLAAIKTIIVSISLATFIPVLVFFVNLFASGNPELRILGGGEVSLGAGMIMMIAGSAYCLFFAVSEVIKNNRLINYRNLIKHGAIGAAVTAFVLFMLLKLGNGSPGWMVFFYLALFATGIIITNNMHAQSNGMTSYGRMITLGFVISVFTVIMLYILTTVFYSKEISQIPVQGSLLFVALILHIQLGLIITSISSALNNTTYIAPPVAPVANTAGQPDQQSNPAAAPAAITGPPFDLQKFIKKNKYIILSLAGLVVLIIGVYYFFIKHYPVSDGKNAAKSYCDCGKEQNEETKEGYKKFMTEFDSYKFSGREEAQQKLGALAQSIGDASQKCYAENQEKFAKLSGRYVGDREKTEKFNFAYGAQLALCNNTDTELTSLYNQVSNKINQYEGPVEIERRRQDSLAAVAAQQAAEQAALAFDNAAKNPPNIERMKQDILGKTFQLPGNELGWATVHYDMDVTYLSFKSSENSFQREASSFSSKINMTSGDNSRTHCTLIGTITYTWDINTNTWNFQNVVVEEFRKAK